MNGRFEDFLAKLGRYAEPIVKAGARLRTRIDHGNIDQYGFRDLYLSERLRGVNGPDDPNLENAVRHGYAKMGQSIAADSARIPEHLLEYVLFCKWFFGGNEGISSGVIEATDTVGRVLNMLGYGGAVDAYNHLLQDGDLASTVMALAPNAPRLPENYALRLFSVDPNTGRPSYETTKDKVKNALGFGLYTGTKLFRVFPWVTLANGFNLMSNVDGESFEKAKNRYSHTSEPQKEPGAWRVVSPTPMLTSGSTA